MKESKEVKTILVEGGIVKVSGESAPVGPIASYYFNTNIPIDQLTDSESISGVTRYGNDLNVYEQALDKFKRECVTVADESFQHIWIKLPMTAFDSDHTEFFNVRDGIYNVEGKGLVYKVKRKNYNGFMSCCRTEDECHCAELIAIVTSKESTTKAGFTAHLSNDGKSVILPPEIKRMPALVNLEGTILDEINKSKQQTIATDSTVLSSKESATKKEWLKPEFKICVSCDEKKEVHEMCIDCALKLGRDNPEAKKEQPEPDFKAMAKEWRIKTYGQQSLIDLQVEGAFISGCHSGLESKQYYENKLEASQRIIDGMYLEIASLEEELRLVRAENERLEIAEVEWFKRCAELENNSDILKSAINDLEQELNNK